MKKRYILLLVLVSIKFLQIQCLPGSNDEIKLWEKLFHRYVPTLRPLIDQNNVLNVTFNMKLIRLLYVEEKSQEVTSQAYFSMKWYNDYLKWNPEDYGNIRYLPVRPEQVWIPDIILKNNADAKALQIQRGTETVWIKYNGKCSWYPKVTIRSSFKANVVDFPFDNQRFQFQFGSWSLGEKKLRILKDTKPMIDKHYLEDAEWDLIATNKEIQRTGYDSDAYSEITFTYTVSRKPAYSVISAILPSLGLMALTLFSYILPPNNGERIKVILTSLLAFTVFLVEMNGYLPRNSEEVPVIQMFYMATMAQAIICFIITCVFARLFGKKYVDRESICVPYWIKRYLLRVKENKKESLESYDILPLKESIVKIKSKGLNKESQVDKKNRETIDENTVEEDLEMSWSDLLNQVDHLLMKIFISMFFFTTATILLPPYYRKHYANLRYSNHYNR